MYYVYFLRSIHNSEKTYIGFTADLKQRLQKHNSGGSVHTSKYIPWKMVTYIAFDCESKARDFEKYVKVGSGNAFAKKRLW